MGNKKITFIKHHLCHAASSFYVSGFKDSLIVVLDGMGEEMTGAIYQGKGEKIKVLKNFFYQIHLEAIIQHLLIFLDLKLCLRKES